MLYSSFTKFKIPNFACSFCFCCTTFPSHLGTFGQQPPVLHWNYNGEVTSKFDLAIHFDWGVILTKGQRVWAAFCMNFSGIPHSTIFGLPQYARQIPFLAIFGVHIWVRYIWPNSNGVSLKISPQKQFRHVDIRLMGLHSQKLSPNKFWCNVSIVITI